MQFQTDIDFALEMDKTDELSGYRDLFLVPSMENQEETVYLCGNSLGLQPKTVATQMQIELENWSKYGVEGHFKGSKWVSYHEKIGELFKDIVGAKKSEIVVMNTLTVNLHLMMVSFYRPTKDRYKIIIEASAFPSDQYAVKSQISFHGYDPSEALIELVPDRDDGIISIERIQNVIEEHGSSTTLIMIGGVNYYSGQVFDMRYITELGHKMGCVVGFDLAHAAGNVELNLHEWGVDFAVWCNYKYLNSGPGSIAGCFVHEKHESDPTLPRFAGWWGHDKSSRFLMGDQFVPMKGAEGWQISNAPIFSMAPIISSLKIFNEATMGKLITKSRLLTNYLQFLIEDLNSDLLWLSPRDPGDRGCQLSLHVKEAGKQLYDKLTEKGVICDWREPDVIRIAPVPLYNSFEDVYKFYRILQEQLGEY